MVGRVADFVSVSVNKKFPIFFRCFVPKIHHSVNQDLGSLWGDLLTNINCDNNRIICAESFMSNKTQIIQNRLISMI